MISEKLNADYRYYNVIINNATEEYQDAKFIERLNVYKESKLYLKNCFTVYPLIQDVLKNESSIFIKFP